MNLGRFGLDMEKFNLEGAEDRHRLFEYLYSLHRELQYVLSHLEASNLTQEAQETLGNSAAVGELRRQVEDTEGNVTQVAQTATELEALLNGTRFTLTAAGVTIRNAAGQVVFEQDANTGNLRIAGQIAATGGTIGGFTIGSTSLYNGTSIVLSSEGQVRLGDLSVEDDAELGPIVRGDGGLRLCVGNSALLVLSESGASTGFPLSAYGGLSINPNDVTNLAANVYVDPATGRLYRTTSTGGGTVTEPLTATAGVSATTVTVGESVTVSVEASGGTAPYVCSLTVSYNDGSFVSLGTGMSVSYTPQSAGRYRFRAVVVDEDGSSVTVYTPYCTAEAAAVERSITVWANKTNVQTGETVTFSWSATGGPSYYEYTLRPPSGTDVTGTTGTQTTWSYTLTQTGTYQFVAYARYADGGDEADMVAVTVTAGASVGATTGTNVNMRSGPGTGYSIVLTIPESGTLVTITGAQTGGWWPVRYNLRDGYISGDYLEVVG